MPDNLRTLVFAAMADDAAAGEPNWGGSLTVAASLVTRHPNLHGRDLHEVAQHVAAYKDITPK